MANLTLRQTMLSKYRSYSSNYDLITASLFIVECSDLLRSVTFCGEICLLFFSVPIARPSKCILQFQNSAPLSSDVFSETLCLIFFFRVSCCVGLPWATMLFLILGCHIADCIMEVFRPFDLFTTLTHCVDQMNFLLP